MADVSVDATVSTATARGMRSVVFTTDLIGYVFYLDATTGDLGYSKTTDGGATWGSFVGLIGPGSPGNIAFDIWYDRWTPGNAGTVIHVWTFDATSDDVSYNSFQTATEVFGTQTGLVLLGASAVAGRGAFVSGCKTRSGYLYCAYDIDAGAERGFHRSTDAGNTWSATLSTTFVEATLDTCKLYPASGTGDDNDCWALYYDASALALTLKLWDSSAASATESVTIGAAHTDGATDLTGQFGYDASVRHSDGHLIAAALSGRDVAASTHQVFDITSTSTITTKTAIAASTDDHYYPQVFIDQGTDAIYVAYNGKRDGSDVLDTTTKVYSTKSTDGGTTWSAGDTAYMEGAAGVVQQVWTPQSGSRFYAVWRVGTTLLGNKVNSVSTGGPAAQAVTGTTIASGSVVRTGHIVDNALRVVAGATLATGVTLPSPHVVTPGAVTVTGATRATTEQLFTGTVSAAAADQAVTGDTLASGAQLFTGTVTPGAVAVAGTTLASGAQLFAGAVTTTTAVSGATLGSTATLGLGVVTTTTSVLGETLGSTLLLFPGTVTTTAAVLGAFVASGATLTPGLVTPGAVTVTGATRASTAQLFPPALVAAGAAVVTDEPFMWLV